MKHYSENLQELFTVPVPENTDTYIAVPHRQVVDTITRFASQQGLTLSKTRHTAFSDGNKVIGYMSFKDQHRHDDTFEPMIAWRNSYDRSMSLAIAAGAMVMICSNGMVLGDITRLRMHTKNIFEDFDSIIYDGVLEVRNQIDKAHHLKTRLSEVIVDKTAVGHILGELYYEHELLRANQLTALPKEIEESAAFAMPNSNGTAWQLYNNITEVLKKSGSNGIQQNKQITEYFANEVAF